MMGSHYYRALLWTFTVSLLGTACGNASFEGNTGGRPVKPLTPGGSEGSPESTLTSLTWYWQCDSDPGAAPTTKGGDMVITGKGNHEFKKEQFGAGIPVTVGGRVCPAAKYPRDIVFVIDVSTSMAHSNQGNDPLVNNSCERLKAVETIISNITALGGDARFGVVTFSGSGKGTQSSSLFADKENLFADVSGGLSAASVLCATISSTNYSDGLNRAKKLLEGARDGALKEIYFVSDGIPDDGDKNPSSSLATALKRDGVKVSSTGTAAPVQIATVMMGSASDNDLKAMASVDKAGASLHARSTEASKLAETLSSLADNEIDDGVIRHRPTGSQAWTEIPLKPNMKGHDFSVPSFQVNPESAPNGMDLQFEYRDQHNNKYSSGGNIVWSIKK